MGQEKLTRRQFLEKSAKIGAGYFLMADGMMGVGGVYLSDLALSCGRLRVGGIFLSEGDKEKSQKVCGDIQKLFENRQYIAKKKNEPRDDNLIEVTWSGIRATFTDPIDEESLQISPIQKVIAVGRTIMGGILLESGLKEDESK